jgi:two-component system CheB/CheR fusion protein
LDLLFCRNLLICLGADAQNRLIPLFHCSLKPGGALFLGSSETLGRFAQFFIAMERKHVFFKKEAPLPLRD